MINRIAIGVLRRCIGCLEALPVAVLACLALASGSGAQELPLLTHTLNIEDEGMNIALCPSPSGGGQTYYVALTGNDSNPGTESSPFQTIQECATTAKAGDTCLIHAGTYRETVTPSSSGTASAPITFAAYNNEKVIVSGADIVPAAWSPDSGEIYKTPLGWDLGRGNNQVFVDGQMILEARYPNTQFDQILTPNTARAESVSVSNTSSLVVVKDSGLTQPASFWDGATIAFYGRWHGYPFSVMTGLVTNSSPGSLTVQFDDAYDRSPPDGQPVDYLLVGPKSALDQPGEWALGKDGNLYVWVSGGSNPSSHQVEAKKRSIAFDLSQKSYITVRGINVFAAKITTDAGSNNNIIDGITSTYGVHFTVLDQAATGDPGNSHFNDGAIILSGSNNTLSNSTIVYSGGDGVALVAGSGQTVFNNTIHDCGYDGSGGCVGAGVKVEDGGQNTRNDKIVHNTIYNSARDGIEFSAEVGGQILYNEVYQAMLLDYDGAAIYGGANYDAGGLQIGYNIIHDVRASLSFGGAIYLDNSEGGVIVHHNVMWNVNAGFWGGSRGGADSPKAPNRFYNNTVSARNAALVITIPSSTSSDLYEFKNNIYDKTYPPAGVSQNNIEPGTDPQFVDPGNHNYHLQAGSPGVDRGLQLSPWTDGYFGSAPDIGAYEFGGPDWTAGANVDCQN